MMQNASVQERVRRVLERYRTDEKMLDAYWQWASNPTPSSGGYALEENCGFIATNLMNRYGKPAIEVVTRLSSECTHLRQEDRVHDLRQAIIQVLNGELGEVLREGVLRRLSDPAPRRQALLAWLLMRAHWQGHFGTDAWVAGEFDWSLGIDLEMAGRDLRTTLAHTLWGAEAQGFDLLREAIAAGVINRLFYRNHTGRMEPKVRPGPRIPLQMISL